MCFRICGLGTLPHQTGSVHIRVWIEYGYGKMVDVFMFRGKDPH